VRRMSGRAHTRRSREREKNLRGADAWGSIGRDVMVNALRWERLDIKRNARTEVTLLFRVG